MTTLRYGLLGCGMMGQEHLRNIALLDDVAVVALADPDPNMRSRASALVPQAHVVNDIDALLALPDLDAMVIASPNFCHADQLHTLLARTELPVLVEKPVVTTREQVHALRAAVAKHPAPLWVAMEYRYMPPIAAFIERIANGATGPLSMLSIREHRFPFLSKVGDWNRFNRNTGGTLVEKCCHFFDLMRLITQSEAIRVYASAGHDVNHLDERYHDEQPDILDNAYVIVDFANGQRAMLELCMFAEGSRYQEKLCAVGSAGKIECFVPGPGRFWDAALLGPTPTPKLIISPRQPPGPSEVPIPVDPTLLDAGDHNGATYYQHCGFLASIRDQQPVAVSIDDGLKAVVIGLAAQASANHGQAVAITDNGFNYL